MDLSDFYCVWNVLYKSVEATQKQLEDRRSRHPPELFSLVLKPFGFKRRWSCGGLVVLNWCYGEPTDPRHSCEKCKSLQRKGTKPAASSAGNRKHERWQHAVISGGWGTRCSSSEPAGIRFTARVLVVLLTFYLLWLYSWTLEVFLIIIILR